MPWYTQNVGFLPLYNPTNISSLFLKTFTMWTIDAMLPCFYTVLIGYYILLLILNKLTLFFSQLFVFVCKLLFLYTLVHWYSWPQSLGWLRFCHCRCCSLNHLFNSRRKQAGVYTSYTFGPVGKQIKVYLCFGESSRQMKTSYPNP